MIDIFEFFKRDRFASHCGIELVNVSKGYAKAKMVITENHLNGIGTLQGGAIFTLGDFTFAAASNSHGNVAVAINVSISFVKAVKKGTLWAQAQETSINPIIATYDVNITDENNELVAIFKGMVYRKKQTLDDVFKANAENI